MSISMKKINLFPLDWNDNQHWIITNKMFIDYGIEVDKNFTWSEGMFHDYIIQKFKLDIKVNFLTSIEKMKELSIKNEKYNLFVKFYSLTHIVEYKLLDYLFLSNKFLLDDIESGKCKLILASLTELPAASYFQDMKEFKQQLKNYNISENKITLFDFMNNMESANKKFNVDFNFRYFNWLMVSWEYYVKLPKTQSNFQDKNYIRDKHYISLNKSTRKQHRQFLLHYLWKNKFLDKGMVSFFYNKKFRNYTELRDGTASWGHMKEELTNCWQQFYKIKQSEIDEFLDWVENNPLYVDVPIKKLKEYRHKFASESSAPNQIFIEKTDNAYLNTYFNILTESCFIETETPNDLDFYLNERNILPINAFQPFIVLNGNNHMEELKKLGFKTFHPHIDETYDTIKDTTVRFNLITKEIDKLCNMSKQEIHDWYWSMENIYKHNYNHLHNVFYPTQIKGFFDEFIYE